MMRSKLTALFFISILFVTGSQSGVASAQTSKELIQQSCQAAFEAEGGFLRGRIYRANGEAASVTMSQAVVRIAQALALQGMWRDVRADREIGTITAGVGAVGNDQLELPLNIVVQDTANNAVSMRAVFTARAGLIVQAERLREMMCGALAAAGGP